MSFQAVTWAIAQTTGSPSAKATLWSIANYANEHWVAYPKQDTIATDSEQSVDSVQRRVDALASDGLLRRIKLKRYGRRTHDFMILSPSPLFRASLEEILPFLPSGCDVMEEKNDAAADCGSDKNDSPVEPQGDSAPDAAADCGSVETGENVSTLPQSAVDATAMVRQHEYITNQESNPQTPFQPETATGLPKEEIPKPEPPPDPRLTRLIETYSEHASAPVLSNPAAIREEAAKFTDEDWKLCQRGAAGVAAVRKRDAKAKGIVGLLRYMRARDLWGHYATYAAADRPAAPQRYWADAGSEEWRARRVLYALLGKPMPPPVQSNHTPEYPMGGWFPGQLPPAGLLLADLADIPQDRWRVLDIGNAEHRQQIAAWRGRVKECLGVDLQTTFIEQPGTHQKVGPGGRVFEIPNGFTGMRVPAEWPPSKVSTEQKAG